MRLVFGLNDITELDDAIGDDTPFLVHRDSIYIIEALERILIRLHKLSFDSLIIKEQFPRLLWVKDFNDTSVLLAVCFPIKTS